MRNDFSDAGFLGYLESEGIMDTNEALISRVAKALNKSPNVEINVEEFRAKCVLAGVDSDSFSSGDLRKLREKLGR